MWKNIKKSFSIAWEAVKSLFSSTFDVLKDGIIVLVKSIYEWSIKIISGLGTILWALLKSIGKALTDGINYLYEKAIDWILKW